MRVIRNGHSVAWLVPANGEVDPTWDEIMDEVREARANKVPIRPNAVLAERKTRHCVSRGR